ncbi:hypothetical protein ACFPN2_31495 [Steroidobacter flavus]|uniref:Uncharacterized protein n=1 Tax=Steroidobacter flavus TaxID=1842136 RepID=A0ABV8T2K7_9GAMM
MEVEEALIELEKKLGIEAPLGADTLPPPRRFAAVLIALRDKICPAYEKIRASIKSDEADLVIQIANLIVAAFDLATGAAMTIARTIALIGMKRFCATPTAVVQV